MQLIHTAALAAFLPLVFVGSLGASDARRDQAAALRHAETGVTRQAAQTKGGAQQRLLLEQQHIRRLIDDLEAGKTVDPAEIDRSLRNAEYGLQ